MGKLDEIHNAQVALAAFNSTDVVAMEVGALGQLFLRQTARQSQLTDTLAKQQFGVLGTHVTMIRTLSLSVYTL